MIRPIFRYGETPLHRPAEPVQEITTDVHELIDDMVETMYAAPGIGLAAPQVGVPLRIFVADPSGGHNATDLVIVINPVFVEQDGMQLEEEGCLSVPGFNATVVRPTHVVLHGLGRDGREQQVAGRGLLARVFQHEMDHLEGTVFIDRLRGVKRDLIARKIRKLQRTGKW